MSAPERVNQARRAPEPRPRTSRGRGPLLAVISGPSGAGKTTLCQNLLAADPSLVRAVTCTTRAPRLGERDGVDYHFLTPEAFQRGVSSGEFLEHATVHGQSYGTWNREVLDRLKAGQDVLLNVDVQGAATIRSKAQEDTELKRSLVSVFLTPPTMDIVEERLRRRGTDSAAVIQKRLGVARQEIAQWKNFDYLLLSSTMQEDLRRMLAIVEAEKMRTLRVQAPEF